jgi:hypothetical protein
VVAFLFDDFSVALAMHPKYLFKRYVTGTSATPKIYILAMTQRSFDEDVARIYDFFT